MGGWEEERLVTPSSSAVKATPPRRQTAVAAVCAAVFIFGLVALRGVPTALASATLRASTRVSELSSVETLDIVESSIDARGDHMGDWERPVLPLEVEWRRRRNSLLRRRSGRRTSGRWWATASNEHEFDSRVCRRVETVDVSLSSRDSRASECAFQPRLTHRLRGLEET